MIPKGLLLLTLILLLAPAGVRASKSPADTVFNRYIAAAESSMSTDSASYYARLAYSSAAKSGNQSNIVDALVIQSKLFRYRSMPDSAMSILEEGLKIAYDLNDPLLTAKLLVEKGRALKMKKDNDEALDAFLHSLNLYSIQNDDHGMARLHIDLAEFYRSLGQYSDAEGHLQQAFAINKRKPLPDNLLLPLYSRTAAVKNETGRLDSALLCSSIALDLSKKTNDLHMQAVSLNELGFLYENKGSREAESYYRQAIELWDKLRNDRYKFNAVINLSRLNLKKKRIPESISLLNEILPIAEKNDWTGITIPAYEQLSECYRLLGDYKQALYYSDKHHELDVRQFRIDYGSELQDIKNRYELEKKNRLLLEKEKEISESRVAYDLKQREQAGIIIGAILLALLSAALIWLSIQKSKANKQLKIALEEKETLFRELHHRVKNNFAVLSGLLHLQEIHTEDEKAVTALQESQYRIKSMAIIHQDLYKQDNNISEIDFDMYIRKLVDMLEHSILPPGKEVRMDVSCNKTHLSVEKAMPLALILQELITNTFKYAFNGRSHVLLGVKMTMNGNNCTLEVYDDGPGLPEGLNLKNSETLGLKLVDMLADQIDATIEPIKESDRKGYKINFNC
jgi:two-component system, sensor histidine kinase PdtaS